MPPKKPPKVKNAMDQPPAAATRSHETYPGEHLGSRSKPPRKRTVEHVGGDEVDPEAEHKSPDMTKSGKGGASEGKSRTKPSKLDGHPVQTEKTHPGGDMVEVEPKEKAKPGRPKAARKGKDNVPEADVATRKATSSTSKSGGTLSTSKKPIKGNAKGAGHVEEHNNVTKTQSKRAIKNKSRVGEDDPAAINPDISPDIAMDESVFNSLLATEKGRELVRDGLEVEGKHGAIKVPRKSKKGFTTEATSAMTDIQGSNKGEHQNTTNADKEAPISKPKKRKSLPSGQLDGGESNVLNQLPEAAPPKKRQKKTTNGAIDAAGDSLGSIVSGVKKSAKAAIDFAGNVASGAHESIIGKSVAAEQELEMEEEEEEEETTRSRVPEKGIPSEETLLKGIESSGDEKDPNEDEGFEKGQLPPAIPGSTFDKINAISSSEAGQNTGEGVIYVGRIPHGFYEHEMRAYFSQFGDISRLRLSRNKTTGASRHFAFIEFDSWEVANIVAETMNNYLLFGHILKVKSIDPSHVDPKIWKGANRRFKKVPWAQIEGRKLAMPMSREQWEKRIEGEQKRRNEKAAKMREMGYEFKTSLKSVDQVPAPEAKKAIGDSSEQALVKDKTLVTEPGDNGDSMMIYESTVTKKIRKPSAKAKEIKDSKEATTASSKGEKRKTEDVLEPTTKRAKKAKAKIDEAQRQLQGSVTDTPAAAINKTTETTKKASGKAQGLVKSGDRTVKIAKQTGAESAGKAKKGSEMAIKKAGGSVPTLSGKGNRADTSGGSTSKKGKTTKT